ncbi:MAG: STAS domain-containing protein [Treponema sp.]|nr:STAS domain-containing protein [Treponema sp.]
MVNNDIIPQFDDDTNESLTITLQMAPGVEDCLIVVLNGYIDTYNTNFFQKQIQRIIEAGFVRLIFNCNGLNYVSSTGIGSFTVFLKTVKPLDGDMVLLNVQPKVYEVFQLLGFSQSFNIKDTLHSAISFFGGAPAEQKNAVFPKLFSCPVCPKKLKTLKAGRFRCPGCKTIITIDHNGTVSLG